MKKRISLILAASLAISMFTAVKAEELRVYALRQEQEALLEAIDFEMPDMPLTENLTRAEFAYLAEQVAYDHTLSEYSYRECFSDVGEDNKYAKEITALYDLGVINGYSNDCFRPDDNITLKEALTVTSRLFNRYTYFDVNENESFAYEMQLTDGIDNPDSKTLNLYSAMVILLNTLDADLTDVAYYYKESDIEEYDTYLKRTFSIYPKEGVCRDDGKVYRDGVREITSDTMLIDDAEVTRGAEYAELYGRRIFAYLKKDSRDEYTLLSYYRKDKKSLTIESGDVADFSDMRIEYYQDAESKSTKKVTIPAGVEVIYNGVPVSAADKFTEDMLVPEKGTIELYCDGSSAEYTTCYVNSYVSYVAMGADAAEEIITTKNEKTIELENYDYVITDSAGEPIELMHIWENSIVLVATPLKSDLLHIMVSSDSFTDRIDAYDAEARKMTTSESGDLDVSVYFERYGYSVKAGKNYEIFTDPFGEAAYVKLIVDGEEYSVGYLLSVRYDVDELGDDYYALKIVNDEATEQTIRLNERVRYFAADEVASKQIKQEQAYTELSGKTGIIRYKLDDYDNITTVELPYTGTELYEKSERLCLLADTSAGSLKYIGYPTYSFGGVVNVNGKTNVWQIPKDREGVDNYVVGGSLPFEHQSSYEITAYGRNKRTALADIVVYNPTALYIKPQPMVITDIKYEYDDKEEEEQYVIEGMWGGTAYSYTIEKALLDNPINMFNEKAETKLAKGDVIKFAVHKGEIIEYTLVYDADWSSGYVGEKGFISGALSGRYNNKHNMGNPCATRYNVLLDSASGKYYLNRTLTPLEANNFSNGQHYLLGYVYSYEDGIINITNQDLHSGNYNSTLSIEKDGAVNEKYAFSTAASCYMTVTGEGKNIRAAKSTDADIKPYTSYGNKCSRVLVCGDGSNLVGVFIMND